MAHDRTKQSQSKKPAAASKANPTLPGPIGCMVGMLSVGFIGGTLYLGDLIGSGYHAAVVHQRIETRIADAVRLEAVKDHIPVTLLTDRANQELENLTSLFTLVVTKKADRALDLTKTKSFRNLALRSILTVKLTSLAQEERKLAELEARRTGAAQAQERAQKKFELLKGEFARAIAYTTEEPTDSAGQAESASDEAGERDHFALYEKGLFAGLPVLDGLPPLMNVSAIQTYNKTESRRLLIQELSSARSTLSISLGQMRDRAKEMIDENRQAGVQFGALDTQRQEMENQQQALRDEVMGVIKAMAVELGTPNVNVLTTLAYNEFRDRMEQFGYSLPELHPEASLSRRAQEV